MKVGEGHTDPSRTRESTTVTTDRIRVLVLYSHQILGEGLEQMLAAEDRLDVVAVSVASTDALDAALADDPDVVVLEEGGPFHPADILGRTRAPVIIDVDIASADAWTYRRDAIRSRPDELLAAVLAGVPTSAPLARGGGGGPVHARRQRMRAAPLPG